jgi:hypothetical protein
VVDTEINFLRVLQIEKMMQDADAVFVMDTIRVERRCVLARPCVTNTLQQSIPVPPVYAAESHDDTWDGTLQHETFALQQAVAGELRGGRL